MKVAPSQAKDTQNLSGRQNFLVMKKSYNTNMFEIVVAVVVQSALH